LPPIDVIGTAPLSSPAAPRVPAPSAPPADISAIDRDKVPANTQTLTPDDLDHSKSSSVPQTLMQRVPGLFITDTAVNPFQPDLQYRGFTALPTVSNSYATRFGP
jgi:iron complex outermembrane receptor protein